MKCAWQELMVILPPWLGQAAGDYQNNLQEIRLRLHQPVELITSGGSIWLRQKAAEEDLKYCINTASRYSPWAAQTIARGYITAPGGHRLGLCGEAVMHQSQMTGIRRAESINIRIARDFPGIGAVLEGLNRSLLIIGPPGSGKTTLLRDIVRMIARNDTVSVVDERGELFPDGFQRGRRMDVLSGCCKLSGIEIALRTMGPDWIAVDEITSEEDCFALQRSGWCGVRLIATAHASCLRDLQSRQLYRPLVDTALLTQILVMNRDKSWKLERMDI